MIKRDFLKLHLLLISLIISFSLSADSQSGEETISLKWKMPIGGKVSGLPVQTPGGGIAVQSENRFIYLISPGGEILKRINTYQRFSGPLTVSPDGTIYTGVGAASLLALSGSGELRWQRRFESPLGENILTGPAGELYSMLKNGTLYSLTPNGTTRWRRQTEADPVLPIGMDRRGRIIVPSKDDFIYCFLPWGEEVWKFKTAGEPLAYCFFENDIIYGSASHTLVRISEDGILIWQIEIEGFVTAIVQSEGRLYVAADNGVLYCIDSEGGVLWKRIHDKSIHDLYLSNDSIIAIDRKGSILLYNKEGSFFGLLENESAYTSGGLSSDNTLILGGADWILYGYNAPGADADAWSQEGGDFGRPWSLLQGMRQELWVSYFENDPDYLSTLAFVNYGLNNRDMESLDKALEGIEETVRGREKFIREPYLMYFLQRIASQHITEHSRTKPEKDYPGLRMRALALMGLLESSYANETYLTLIEHEWNEAVLIAVFENFRRMPSDPSGTIVDAISRRVQQESGNSESFYASAVKALLAAVRYRGRTPGDQVMDSALHIFKNSRDPVTKRNALDILRY